MDQKSKRLYLNISSAFVIQGIAMLISFVNMPLYIKYFNDENVLGLWFTILSILTWILTFDFGVGNGLRNKLVPALEGEDRKSVKEYISSSYFLLGLITFILILVLIPIILFVDWTTFFNIDDTLISNSTLKIVVMINLGSILLQFFFRLINSIIYAIQKSVINNSLALITSIIQLFFIMFYRGNNVEKNLILLSIVHLIAVNLPLIIVSFVIFSKQLKEVRPNIKYYSNVKGKEVLFSGGIIFFNQILYLLLTGTNTFIISRFIMPSEVVEYQIYFRIFITLATLYGLVLTPLWSAVTQAKANKDFKWINKFFKLSLAGAGLIVVGQIIGVLLLQFGFNIWLRENAPLANYLYGSIFALFGVIFALQSVVSTFAMGFNRPILQTIMYIIAVLLKFVLLKMLIKNYQTWIIIVVIDIIAFVPYIIAEYISINKYIKKQGELDINV